MVAADERSLNLAVSHYYHSSRDVIFTMQRSTPTATECGGIAVEMMSTPAKSNHPDHVLSFGQSTDTSCHKSSVYPRVRRASGLFPIVMTCSTLR